LKRHRTSDTIAAWSSPGKPDDAVISAFLTTPSMLIRKFSFTVPVWRARRSLIGYSGFGQDLKSAKAAVVGKRGSFSSGLFGRRRRVTSGKPLFPAAFVIAKLRYFWWYCAAKSSALMAWPCSSW
jgi:hypothetical protein